MASNSHGHKALAALQRGDLISAERWALKALRANPRDLQALLAHGVVLNGRGQYADAASAFRQLTELQPTEPTHWANLATAERSAGQIPAAVACYERAVAIGGWTVDLLYNSALLELQRGDFQLALERLAAAVSHKPVDAEVGCCYAQLLMQGGEPAALRSAVSGWQHWQRWTIELLADFGMLLLAVGDQPSALGILERLRLQSDNPLAVEMTLISMLERTNQLEEATDRLRRLPLRPGWQVPAELQARWLALRAQLAGRNDRHAEAIALYREMLQSDVPLVGQQEILFPLATELDADGQYEAAMDAAFGAHASQMAHFDLTAPRIAESEQSALDIADGLCVADDVARWFEPEPPSMQDSPVFIVAFPRSGTTLLEQMLDAHPGLQTMDEQRFLLDAQERLQEFGLDYPNKLADATPPQLADARRRYWEQVATKVKLEPGQRLLDKNPLNMLRLPVIQRLWPNAPIVLAIRHPFDVITSNFFQQYRAPDFARLCRDLPSLADGYASIFDVWYRQSEVLQPKVLELFYEVFVSDFENQSRRIAEFCELPWHAAMLDPSRQALRRGYIATPSYHQVIRPVNRSAVDRWRRYEGHLLPLRDRVAHLLLRWGYAA